MPRLNYEGTEIELTTDGRLRDLAGWSEGVARQMAANEGLELTDQHWQIIQLMRDYYSQYNISPIKKLLKKAIRTKIGKEFATDKYLNSLFPRGVLIQGTQLAGLPIPHLDAEIEHSLAEALAGGEVSEESPDRVSALSSFQFEGCTYHLRQKGNLVENHAWNERMAVYLAGRENLVLTDDHWVVVNFLRQFYFDYGITPMVRLLINQMRDVLGDEKSNSEYLYRLFPGGPSRQGSRIAGLPEPQGCVDD